MVVDVALYLAVHQPRRVKLPAQPIPRGASLEDMTRCLFDERLNEHLLRQTAQASYYPTLRLLLELVKKQDLRLALGCSLAFIQQAARWEPALLDLLRELVACDKVELVGMDPYRSLHCLLDLPGFSLRVQWMLDEFEQRLGRRPQMIDMSELGISGSIYHALDAAGLRGAIIESDARVMRWRSSTYLYHAGAETPSAVAIELPTRARRDAKSVSSDRPPYTVEEPREHAPYLLTRHEALSAEVNTHFSNRAQAGNPLYADAYAEWIARVEGDYTLVGWDIAALGAQQEQGIFAFLRALPEQFARVGVSPRTPGEIIEQFSSERAYHLPLPGHSPMLASFSNPDLYCEHAEQRVILQLMSDVYNLARLTEHPDLLNLALWLAQADNLHLLQWPGPQLASDTPQEWWQLGPLGLFHEQKQVYENALHACATYLPARIQRQQGLKKPAKSARTTRTKSKKAPVPEASASESGNAPAANSESAPVPKRKVAARKSTSGAAQEPVKTTRARRKNAPAPVQASQGAEPDQSTPSVVQKASRRKRTSPPEPATTEQKNAPVPVRETAPAGVRRR